MQTYIAMLRGINVSGREKIKMADLRAYLSELDWQDLNTYIQSGNIVFRAEVATESLLAKVLADKIREKYEFDVPVLVKTQADVEAVVNENPFPKADGYDSKYLHVTFLAKAPTEAAIEVVKAVSHEPEQFIWRGTHLYLYAPKGYGRAKLNNNFLERKLDVQATTRNWKTVNKLLEMAQGE